MNDFILHAMATYIMSTATCDLCLRTDLTKTQCILLSSATSVSASLIKEFMIDEKWQSKDLAGDVFGLSIGLAVKF